MQRFSPSILDPANKSQLWRLLQDMSSAIESSQQETEALRQQLQTVGSAAGAAGAVDYARIRDALSTGGSAPLSITGLVGLAADPQRGYALIADSVAGLPDPTVLEVGTIGAVLTAGVYQVYFVASGNPRTWQATTLTAPANMMTTDTNQTPGAAVVKTWTAQQIFSGGLTAAGAVAISAGGLSITGSDTNIGAELLLSGVAVIDNTSSPYTVAANIAIVAVNTSTGAVTVNLPATVKLYRIIIIKDVSGNAAANNITISGNGNNVDGAASITLAANYASRMIQGTGSDWNVLLGYL